MRLLVCDDHEMFLGALVEALDVLGHRVVGRTHDPSAVPALVCEHRPDVLILDVDIDGTSGVDVAGEVRALPFPTAVLLLTASTEDWVREAYDDGRVDGLVNKSSALHGLDGALTRVHRGERPLVAWPSGPPPSVGRTALDLLTQREREVLMLLLDGVSTAGMAERLHVSVNTVRSHVRNILRKLGVRHRTGAANAAFELGLAPAV
jgi:DNA-binding NarL/FixJ family response regulator